MKKALGMSETQDQTTPLQSGAGAVLRQARERAGLHVGALSVILKVPVKRLEALEADRFDLLPSAVFTRALVLSVCRHLKLDPQQVLPLLPDPDLPVLSIEGSLNQPFRSPSHNGPGRPWYSLTLPVLLTAGGLALAAALVFFWPEISAWGQKEGTSKTQAPSASVITEPVQPLRLQHTPADSGPLAGAAQSTASAGAPVAPSGGASPSSSVPKTSASSVSAESSIVLFQVHKPTWVEVMGPGEQVVLRRLLQPGEQVPVTAAPLLRVTVGDVTGVTVLVRGSPFDLGPIARGPVARFEVQ